MNFFQNIARANTQILLLMDSHGVGTFGKHLDSLLRASRDGENSYDVWTYARCGASAGWWFSGQLSKCGFFTHAGPKGFEEYAPLGREKTPLVEMLLSERVNSNDPLVTILELGTNDSVLTDKRKARSNILKLAQAIHDAKSECIWIGPPTMRKIRGKKIRRIYSYLKETNCHVIKSIRITKYPTKRGGGIHFDLPELQPIAEKWAEKVNAEIRSILRKKGY